jgi:hypothetical protein
MNLRRKASLKSWSRSIREDKRLGAFKYDRGGAPLSAAEKEVE